MEPWRSGKSGMYLRVLKWLSEYGLSSETWGRLWVLVTPKSAINSATGFEVIEVPRSAWMVKSPATMPCFAHVSAISRLASSAVSRGATIQPTTWHETRPSAASAYPGKSFLPLPISDSRNAHTARAPIGAAKLWRHRSANTETLLASAGGTDTLGRLARC